MFRLVRYYSFASAIIIGLVTVVLAFSYWKNATDELVHQAESGNLALARAFTNTLWPRFSGYVASVSKTDGDALRARTETAEIHQALKKLTAGVPVLKVKIYNLDGTTVYSSDARQIGEDKSSNPGFNQAARHGLAASKLSYRDTFSAFSGVKEDRSLVESYLPVGSTGGTIEGVFELYTDVTPLVARINSTTIKLTAGLLVIFGVLYGFLFLIVRHADKALKAQYADLQRQIADRRKAEKELGLAKEEAEAANIAKSDFLAGMSHELRTPLNAIIGFSEAMGANLWGPLGHEKYREYADDILAAGQHLLALINDVLDLSKIEARKLVLNEGNVSLDEVVKECLRVVQARALEEGLHLKSEIPARLPLLFADDRAVKQVLLNLLSNSVKFTPENGSITIDAGMAGDGWLRVAVTDTGIGMSKEDIDIAMKEFGQVRGSTPKKEEGTGLGITLSRKLMEAHGGTLEIESEVDIGTTVTVQFPPERVINQ